MITASNYGKKILDGLFHTGTSASATTVSFPADPYLGLFTTMPNADGTGGVEVSADEYGRINLTNTGVYNKQLIAPATIVDGDGKDSGKKLAKVVNQDEIHFPVIPQGGTWGTIVGFGIFDSASGGTPYFWGELTAPVETGSATSKTAVFFDIGDFVVTLV